MRFLIHIPATVMKLPPVRRAEVLEQIERLPLTDNDRYVVGLGGMSEEYTEELVEILTGYHSLKPWVQCGPKRVEIAKRLSVPRVLVDWEPMSVGPTWDNTPITNLVALQQVFEKIAPKKHGVTITGVPLRTNIGWKFNEILERSEIMTVMTQGFVRQKRTTERLNTLAMQVPRTSANVYCSVVPGLLNIAGGPAVPNGVTKEAAIIAMREWPNWMLFGGDIYSYAYVMSGLRIGQ